MATSEAGDSAVIIGVSCIGKSCKKLDVGLRLIQSMNLLQTPLVFHKSDHMALLQPH